MLDLKATLRKTRESLVAPLRRAFRRDAALGGSERDDLEELLLRSDMGVEACEKIMRAIETMPPGTDPVDFLKREFLELLGGGGAAADEWRVSPRAILVVGVNGVGKTTSIAKLARFHRRQGRTVILAAADTFRAAARDQLAVWAERLSLEIVAHKEGGDPAAVAYDACAAAKARSADAVIVDTAGRLHTRVNLMEELRKIRRACEKVLGADAVQSYLVLDATLGQNSLRQAAEFTRSVGAEAIILTKLDSTARGGIVIAIKRTLGIPVRFVGTGEGVDDFAEFSPAGFVDALLSD